MSHVGKSENRAGLATVPGQRSPLGIARECFDVLVAGPAPLCVDCRGLAGLPNRSLPLDDLLDRFLHGRCPRQTKDIVWSVLVRRARAEGATWSLACAGMALPALAAVAGRLTARYAGDPDDVHAEVLAGFLAALATVDLERPRVLVRLKWAAYRRGFAALAEAVQAPTPIGHRFDSTPPQPPWGHPDLVLAQAVRQRVLNRTEADLIGSTRLDEESVSDWAAGHSLTPAAAYKSRRRAEKRLVAFLHDKVRLGDPDDPFTHTAMADHPPSAGARRLHRPPAQPSLAVPRTSVTRGPGKTTEKSTGVSKNAAQGGLFGCRGSLSTCVAAHSAAGGAGCTRNLP
ncbi:hypothetical protein [Streptomyces lasiicapitis]|uniref:hypothetical protein n=1 Tax=Streptomyces lasiicapitis TaxID=1923961 RepID=UPI0036475E01